MMFLKSVKARGFKSFASPVEFAFEPGITVVVGPNGSGKSNIADAVVWAMGEQSPTAVRGSSMQDVIFSGSDKLAPSGMAEVEILLDNSSGVLPIEFSDVLISRRLYRDGEGQYFINRSACRLIDVGEILSDAGLGRDGHSIISQGKVDAVLESKPYERRAHIEEAAGLGKFKKRRRRAERKLEAVRRNLDRLADVEEEVKGNLRPLKRQATAAERSARLDRQIAITRTRLIKGRLAQLNRELQHAESASRDAGERRRRYEQRLAETAAERRGAEELLTDSLRKHKQLASRFYDLDSRRQALEQRHEFIGQRRGLLARAGKRAGERIGNLQGQIERAEAELKRADDDRSRGCIHLEEVESELEARQDKLGLMLEQLGRLRRDSEEKSRRIGDLGALKDRYRHQVEYLSRRRKKLAVDEERTAGEIETALREQVRLEAQIMSSRSELDSGRHELGEAESAVAEARSTEKELEKKYEETSRTLRFVAEDLKIAKARITFLGDSDRDRAGLPPAAKKLSEERDIKALVDIIEVEPGYEQAVAAVMGRALFALAVRDMDQARELLDSVRSREMGSVEFVIPGWIRDGVDAEVKDSLLRHVSVSEEWRPYLSKLLAGVSVVEDAPADPGSEGVWVTLEGVVYHGRRRLLSFRSDPPSSVVLKHRHERVRLEQECETALKRHRSLAEELAHLEMALDEARKGRREADRDFGELATAAREQDEGLEALERRLKVLKQQAELAGSERDHFREEMKKLGDELAEARERLSEAESNLATLDTANAEGDDGGLKQLSDEKAELEKEVTELQINAARVREREQVAAGTVERITPVLQRLRDDLVAVRFQQEAYRRFEPVCVRLLETCKRLQSAFNAVIGQMDSRLKGAESESEKLSAALGELSQAEAELQQQLSRASDNNTDCEVGLAKLRDQAEEQQSQLKKLGERYADAGLDEVEAALPEELDETEEQIERLERRRENIGPVNPLAQQEYEEMLERQRFLAEQRQDLEQSLAELNGLIRELTERIETTFSTTFEAVRKNFSEVVATLFPGGEGRMTIVEPEEKVRDEEDGEVSDAGNDDLTEEEEEDAAAGISIDRRGIEISVKPARKAVRSLSLLSGGERSLVAIAFLFSIFLARPAPFYILDEVEAALDDSNIDRLLHMLRSFQDRTQFIVITHQKRTMEVADSLYGVSMGADGTSKVLSRRMHEGDGGDPGDGEEMVAVGAFVA